MSSSNSLVFPPGFGSPSRLRSIDLKAVQGENCEGRLAPAASSVKPNTRPGPLKIWTSIRFAPRFPLSIIGAVAIPRAGSIPLIFRLRHYQVAQPQHQTSNELTSERSQLKNN